MQDRLARVGPHPAGATLAPKKPERKNDTATCGAANSTVRPRPKTESA